MRSRAQQSYHRGPREDDLSYVIAAYAIVIGSLVGYGLWIQLQRRALIRESAQRSAPAADGSESERP